MQSDIQQACKNFTNNMSSNTEERMRDSGIDKAEVGSSFIQDQCKRQDKKMENAQKIRDHSPDNESPSILQSEQSHDILISKHLIPPPLMLLPKPTDNQPKSLMPMLPLPAFVGIIPNFQPLDAPLPHKTEQDQSYFNWIGDAFDNIVYQKYEETSYCKIDDVEENWNIWACDVVKLTQPANKSQHTTTHNSNNTNTNTNTNKADQQLKPYYTAKSPTDLTLIFESRFESGNLSLVSKITETQYNLLLQNDINTNGYSQWFFFKVSNTRKGTKVRFNILNLYKHNSLYRSGMKVIMYSVRESEEKNVSWHRAGDNIQYFENGYSKSTTEYKPFYTLSWEYTFPHTGDEVYFAYSYPFTYSNLNNLVQKIESDPFTRNICNRSTLCKTLAGNRVDILTITEDHPFEDLEKGYIVITARIHPGQTVSSYVCNGILEFLLSSNEKARKLRQHFVFKIIPMLNPDGVIHGNYRSNISGFDLNRKWENPSKLFHPEIYYCKKLIEGINEIGEVVFFCDLHGHSMKKNAFIYGSHDTNDPRRGKEFPFLISKLFRGFSFRDCSFLKKEEREGTTRTVLAQSVYNNNVFTLESSFCGPEYENIHFTVRHFEELGQKFCQAILLTFRDRMKEMHIEAAMRNNSANFPNLPNDDSQIQYDSLMDFQEIDEMNLRERVNSENSQGQEQENQQLTMLEDKTIKKYLILKNTRPHTSLLMGRRNQFFKKSLSKDLTIKFKQRKVEFNIHKSNSPTKRKQLYEPPKVQKIKTGRQHNQKIQKIKLQPKLFEPIEFMSVGLERKRNYRSTTKLGSYGYESERPMRKEEPSSNIKIVLNKNYEFKAEEPETFFKNSTLKSHIKQEPKKEKQRRMSDFIIRKSKVNIIDDRNSTNLFKSVLSSLRKDKK